MPSTRTYARILFYSRSFTILAGLAAVCVLVFFGLNLWVYDLEPLLYPIDTQALVFSLIAALLALLSTWLATRFLNQLGSSRPTTYRAFRRTTLLLWVLFIPIVFLSVFSLFLFFQTDFEVFLYPLSMAAIAGVIGLQVIFIILWTIAQAGAQ
ncbi:MAG: hypothetical protein ACFFCO_09745 [Promethearchaeota archaeon]